VFWKTPQIPQSSPKRTHAKKAFKFPSKLIDFGHFWPIWLQVAILGVLEDPPDTTKFSKTQACQKAFKFPSELVDFGHFWSIWLQVANLRVLEDPPDTTKFSKTQACQNQNEFSGSFAD
jgi:hypothetical protein